MFLTNITNWVVGLAWHGCWCQITSKSTLNYNNRGLSPLIQEQEYVLTYTGQKKIRKEGGKKTSSEAPS